MKKTPPLRTTATDVRDLFFFLALAFVVLSCSRSAELSGDVFVRMKSGDVKRAAGIEVFLIPASQQFEAEWKKAVEDFEKAYAEAPLLGADLKVDAPFEKRFPRFAVAEAYRTRAMEIIRAAQPKAVRTDINGHYELKSIRPGKYYLFAGINVFREEVFWMVPVEVKGGAQKIDLSNSNAGWPFSLGRP